MAEKSDNSSILYAFSIELEKHGYDTAILEDWMRHYPSAADELMEFFIDEVRTEEMESEGTRSVPVPSLDLIKATGLSQVRLRLVRRGNASKRA
jgi:hypothetical protein